MIINDISMNQKTIEFSKEKIREAIMTNKYTFREKEDFIHNALISELLTYLWTNNKQKRTIEKEVGFEIDPPKFFDWLFKKKKTIYKKVVLDVDSKDVLLNPPLVDDVQNILRLVQYSVKGVK